MSVGVEKMAIFPLVLMFIMYIGIHLGIAFWNKKNEEQLSKNADDEEIKKAHKLSNFLYKWFPAIYLIGILMLFYVGQ